MQEFSATSVATEGFHLMRRSPMALLWWALTYLGMAAVMIGFVAATVGFAAFSNLPELVATAETEELDPALVLSLASAIGAVIAICAPIAIIVNTVLVTAVKRAVLRPEQSRFGYMRLGMDEVRVFVVRLVRWLILASVWIVLIVGAALLGRLIHPLVGVPWVLAGLAAVVFLSVKLSLAVSQTFAERRIHIFGSWRLTGGQFWNLVATYLLAFVFVVGIAIVLSIVSSLAGGDAFTRALILQRENTEVVMKAAGFSLLVGMVVNLIGEVLNLPIMGAPPAAAYRELTMAEEV